MDHRLLGRGVDAALINHPRGLREAGAFVRGIELWAQSRAAVGQLGTATNGPCPPLLTPEGALLENKEVGIAQS